jgi:hypothetical protein
MTTIGHLKQSEAAFQRAVIELARMQGWRVGHIHDSRRQVAPGRFVGDKDAAGIPDLLLVRDSRLLAIELKTDKGRLTDEQVAWMHALDVAETVEAAVWRPKMWDGVVRELAR